MKFAFALAAIAVIVSAKKSTKKTISSFKLFDSSLDSIKQWRSYKHKTKVHRNSSNALMRTRDRAVAAWFRMKTRAAYTATKQKKAAAYLIKRNTINRAAKAKAAILKKKNSKAAAAKTAALGAYNNAKRAAALAKKLGAKKAYAYRIALNKRNARDARAVAAARKFWLAAHVAAVRNVHAHYVAARAARYAGIYAKRAKRANKKANKAYTVAVAGASKSRAVAVAAHKKYAAFIRAGHANGFIH